MAHCADAKHTSDLKHHSDTEMKIKLLISSFLLSITCSHASTLNLLQYQHENLRSGKLESLANDHGDIKLLMFFEPDCSWCYKQIKALNQISRQCPKISLAALGINGKRHQLKKDLWRLKPQFPAFVANANMVSDIGNIPATPITLVIDQKGHYLSHLRGYTPSKKILAQLSAQHGIECSS